MDTKVPIAYLDTCILSGLARGDLKPNENAAITQLVQLQKENRLKFVTSEHAKEELSQSPIEKSRVDLIIYNLIASTPLAAFSYGGSNLSLLGIGGPPKEYPLFTELKALLSDLGDAKHVYQAKNSNVDFFVTTDERTILRPHKGTLKERYGISVILPSDLLLEIQK